MSQLSDIFNNLGRHLLGYLNSVIAFLPNLIGALLVLAVAWLIGRLLRALTLKVLREVSHIFERLFHRGILSHVRLSDFAVRALGNLVFFLVVLFGLDGAVRVLQLSVAIRWLDRAIVYVPTILAGVIILLIGIMASRVVRDLATSALSTSGNPHAAKIGQFAQILALTVAIVVGLDQIEIDVDLPISLIVVVSAAALGGLALAFGLGAQNYTANLIAAQQISRQFQSGDIVEISGTKGTIAEITSTTVVLGTEKGRAIIPARVFFEQLVHVSDASRAKPDS